MLCSSADEKWIIYSPEYSCKSLLEIRTLDASLLKFMLCSILDYHRCLSKQLWKMFKLSANVNATHLDHARKIVAGLQNKCEIKISTFLHVGTTLNKKKFKSKSIRDLILAIREAIFLSPHVEKIFQLALSRGAKIIYRRNQGFRQSRELYDWHVAFRATPAILNDISFQLPTGLLTIARSTPFEGDKSVNSICFPNIWHPELFAQFHYLEIGKLLKCTFLSLLPTDVLVTIVNYSMDEYQLLCRYVELECSQRTN